MHISIDKMYLYCRKFDDTIHFLEMQANLKFFCVMWLVCNKSVERKGKKYIPRTKEEKHENNKKTIILMK